LLAQIIHHNSSRKDRAFQNITCSALPATLLESELFGHERGAFTDAKVQKKGLLELADGGTVFLDEFTEMDPMLQAKLLRFLEEKAFRRVGGVRDIRVDVRVIAATNRDMKEAVRSGALRKDLYYRLQVLTIEIPPLRRRVEDILPLARFLIDLFNREFGKDVRGLDRDARALLENHPWEGNVRELHNAIERAMLFAEGDRLTPADFPALTTRRQPPQHYQLPAQGIVFQELERSLVHQALERCRGNRTRAAALLGMTRDQIRYRIEKFGLA
jgi:transcriptional regulator with PAS, ATPase and Fis domain